MDINNNNNNNNNINNNNDNNNDNNNGDGFLKINRNKYLHKIIFNHVHLYNIFKNALHLPSIESLNNIIKEKKLESYIKSINFRTDQLEGDESLELFLDLVSNLESLETLSIQGEKTFGLPELRGFYSNMGKEYNKPIIYKENFNANSNIKVLRLQFIHSTNQCLSNLTKLNKLEITDLLPQCWTLPANLSNLFINYHPYLLCENIHKLVKVSSINKSIRVLKLRNAALDNFSFGEFTSLYKLFIYGVPNVYPYSFLDKSNLPDQLQILSMESFNQKLSSLPSSLTKLDLGNDFDQVISLNVLPPTLLKLIMLNNNPVNSLICSDALPRSLVTLKLGAGYTLDKLLPPHLSKVECNPTLFKYFPQSVTTYNFALPCKTSIGPFYSKVPSHIKFVRLPFNHNSEFDFASMPYLTHLVFNKDFKSSLKKSPMHTHYYQLVYLDLGSIFNIPIQPFIFPSTLVVLKLSNQYKHPFLKDSLPMSLRSLSIGTHYSLPLEYLPDQLLILEIHYLSNNMLSTSTNESLLPSSLKYLIIQDVKQFGLLEAIPPIDTIFLADYFDYSKIIQFNIFKNLKSFKSSLDIFKKLNNTYLGI